MFIRRLLSDWNRRMESDQSMKNVKTLDAMKDLLLLCLWLLNHPIY